MRSSGPGRASHRLQAIAIGAFVTAFVASLIVPVGVDGAARWTGGMDLYRPGVYTEQKTLLWCTAADVQIIRNIVDRHADHARASQARYFSWMRLHNRYAIPVSDGVDPAGWTAGLRHYVDDRYRLVQSTSFSGALRAAVTSLRRTNLPVGLLVARGDHAWVMTGFTATADPAVTASFTVTSVRVVGPLYGIQSLDGYDMAPDTKLTPSQLRGFWTPWHYARIRMAWEGRILAVEGSATVAASRSASQPASVTATQPASGPADQAASGPAAHPASASESPSASGSRSAAPASATGPVRAGQAAASAKAASLGTSSPLMSASAASPAVPSSPAPGPSGLVAGIAAGLVVIGAFLVAVAVRFRSTAAGVSTRARRPTRRQHSG